MFEVPSKEDFLALLERVQALESQLQKIGALDGTYMSIESVALMFEVTPATVHRWANEGQLQKYYPNGDETKSPRFAREEVETFYKAKKTPFFT